MKLSIIIPAYNEEKRIGKTLEEYSKFFEEKLGKNFEIIIVINGTKDHTEGVVKEYAKKFKGIKYLNFKEGGKGFAVKEGFKVAEGELIGFVDADLATSPEEFYKLCNLKGYDGSIASRYLPGAIVKPKQSFSRVLASRVFNFVTRSLFIFNFRDTQCGAKLFKKQVIDKILEKLSISKWAFDIDLLYNSKKLGFKIKEVPTRWEEPGGSHINLKKDSLKMLFSILQLRILTSSFKRMFKVVRPIAKATYGLLRRESQNL